MRLIAIILCMASLLVLAAIITGELIPTIDRIETMVGSEQRAAQIECSVKGMTAHIVEKDGKSIVTCEHTED